MEAIVFCKDLYDYNQHIQRVTDGELCFPQFCLGKLVPFRWEKRFGNEKLMMFCCSSTAKIAQFLLAEAAFALSATSEW